MGTTVQTVNYSVFGRLENLAKEICRREGSRSFLARIRWPARSFRSLVRCSGLLIAPVFGLVAFFSGNSPERV